MKPVFQGLVALIAIGAIGALVLSFTIDGIVKSNIESTTGEMLDTSVEVNSVSISILDGKGTIDGITIHNPEGFSDNPALKLQQISISVALSSLLSDTVIVKDIRIEKPEVYFEQKTSGSNLDALTDKLGGSSSESGVSIVIDHLLVQDGHVTLTADIGEKKTVEGSFSSIELNGIGRSGNNTMEQAMQQILKPILRKASREAVKQGLLNEAKDKLKDLLDG